MTKAKAAGKRALFAGAHSDLLADTAVFCHGDLSVSKLNGDHDLTFH